MNTIQLSRIPKIIIRTAFVSSSRAKKKRLTISRTPVSILPVVFYTSLASPQSSYQSLYATLRFAPRSVPCEGIFLLYVTVKNINYAKFSFDLKLKNTFIKKNSLINYESKASVSLPFSYEGAWLCV